MAKVTVSSEFPVSEAKLWELVSDFGNVGWLPGAPSPKIEGSGPGMIRYLGENGEIHERLESVDKATKTVVYSIPVGIPFPVTGYRATMKVSGAGSGGSRLDWSCEMEPNGVSEEEACKILDGMYNTMMGWIGDYLTR